MKIKDQLSHSQLKRFEDWMNSVESISELINDSLEEIDVNRCLPKKVLDALHDSGFDSNDFDVLTGTPYPEGAFGEHVPQHRLFRFPLFGAIMGLTLSVFLTTTTQIVYPLITGGKPILSIFAMLVIMYEMTMLSAVVTTVIGILFESRLPDISMNVYDTRITEGLIGVSLVCSTDKKDNAEKALKDAGAMEIKSSGK